MKILEMTKIFYKKIIFHTHILCADDLILLNIFKHTKWLK